MAAGQIPLEPPKGVRFDMRVSLANIIQLLILFVLAVMAWTTIQNRQDAFERTQQEQQKEIRELVSHQEVSAQIESRAAALIEGIEVRLNRVENQEDNRRKVIQ